LAKRKTLEIDLNKEIWKGSMRKKNIHI
jgi:hypothetical protein